MPDKAQSGDAIVLVAGASIPAADLITADVNKDLDQPNMAVITLRNHHHVYSAKYSLGDALQVKDQGETVFQGKVAGIEPIYRGEGANTVVLLAFDSLDRLPRRRRARRTYHGSAYFLKIDGGDLGTIDGKGKSSK